MSKKFLDASGIQHLWKQLSLKDYPNNEMLVAVINAITDTAGGGRFRSGMKVWDMAQTCV